jgi:ribosomal-protein-alanine N-acetyltransferase
MMQLPGPVLKGERVVLRLPERRDVLAIASYFRDNLEHLSRFSPVPGPRACEEAYWDQRVAEIQTEFQRSLSTRFFMFEATDDCQVIGMVSLYPIVRGSFHACTLGYSLARTHEGHGWMTEALRLVIDFGFRDLRLHRIMANYAPENLRSADLLHRLGFQVEGYARDYLLVNGRWHDHFLSALTNHQWTAA